MHRDYHDAHTISNYRYLCRRVRHPGHVAVLQREGEPAGAGHGARHQEQGTSTRVTRVGGPYNMMMHGL